MNTERTIIQSLPKVELHLHLDCSLSYNVVKELNPAITFEEYSANFIAPEKCNSLTEFLKCTSSGIDLMQTEKALISVIRDLFEQLKFENVIYAEIRFAPLLHINSGLSPERVVKIVSETIKECISNYDIEARVILCALRHFSEEQSLETVILVDQFLNSKLVVGLDLAADEAGYPIDNHIKAFEYAIKKNIYRTAHAGEAKGAESVVETILNLQPSRIGHGVRSIENPDIFEILVKNNIHLEVCPTSNIQTNVFDTYSDHPVNDLYQKEISLSINTDARSLTNVTLTQEYQKLVDTFNWTKNDFYKCNLNALKSAFLSESEKKKLIEKLNSGYL